MHRTIRITKRRPTRLRVPQRRPSYRRPTAPPARATARRRSSVSADDALRLGIVAHEAATCMTPMAMQLELLLSSRLGKLEPRQERALRVVERSLDRLAVLLKDASDHSRMETDTVRLERRDVDLVPLIDQTVAACGPAAERAEVSVTRETTSPLSLVADPDRLLQVITNLLTNAIKFTPAGGEVVVAAHDRGDHVEMQVSDSGRGLDPQQMERLFEPFVRFHGHLPGSGLGLYITQGIVTAHGGTIDVSSPGPGHGSTFTVRLPAHRRSGCAAEGGV